MTDNSSFSDYLHDLKHSKKSTEENGKCFKYESTTIEDYFSMPSLVYRIYNDMAFSSDNVYIINNILHCIIWTSYELPLLQM